MTEQTNSPPPDDLHSYEVRAPALTLRAVFFVLVAVWLGGALVGQATGSRVVHEISVNIFGSLAILLGLFLAVRWAVRRLRKPQS